MKVAPFTHQAFPIDTTAPLERLLGEYERNGTHDVSFRELVPWIKVGERATHYLHSYPAKLLPHIAHFFLASRQIGQTSNVLDPFCGSGTIAVETVLSGRTALYADVNPLARLITRVKTRRIEPADIERTLIHVHDAYRRCRRRLRPNVINLDLWYDPPTVSRLVRLKTAIDNTSRGHVRDFLLVSFSQTCRRVSLADPKFSVPVRGRDPIPEQDVWAVFAKQTEANLSRQRALNALLTREPQAICLGDDARQLQSAQGGTLAAESVDLIVTSPPYAGAQKYIRASSLSLGWLGLASASELRSLEQGSIGREHFRAREIGYRTVGVPGADAVLARIFQTNPVRFAIAASYLVEMRTAIQEMYRVLRPGGHAVIVVGNNTVCGELFDTSAYITEMLTLAGLRVMLKITDEIPSRTLITKRRNSATVIAREAVILLKKDPQ